MKWTCIIISSSSSIFDAGLNEMTLIERIWSGPINNEYIQDIDYRINLIGS